MQLIAHCTPTPIMTLKLFLVICNGGVFESIYFVSGTQLSLDNLPSNSFCTATVRSAREGPLTLSNPSEPVPFTTCKFDNVHKCVVY